MKYALNIYLYIYVFIAIYIYIYILQFIPYNLHAYRYHTPMIQNMLKGTHGSSQVVLIHPLAEFGLGPPISLNKRIKLLPTFVIMVSETLNRTTALRRI